jgi:hypothetical protein
MNKKSISLVCGLFEHNSVMFCNFLQLANQTMSMDLVNFATNHELISWNSQLMAISRASRTRLFFCLFFFNSRRHRRKLFNSFLILCLDLMVLPIKKCDQKDDKHNVTFSIMTFSIRSIPSKGISIMIFSIQKRSILKFIIPLFYWRSR